MGHNLSGFSSPELRLWVPSPSRGEGQDEGHGIESFLLTPLTLTLSPQGRGDNVRIAQAMLSVVAGAL